MDKKIETKQIIIPYSEYQIYEDAVKKLDEISKIGNNALVIRRKGSFSNYSISYDISIVNHNEAEEHLKSIIDMQIKEIERLSKDQQSKLSKIITLSNQITLVKNELSGLIGRTLFRSLINKL